MQWWLYSLIKVHAGPQFQWNCVWAECGEWKINFEHKIIMACLIVISVTVYFSIFVNQQQYYCCWQFMYICVTYCLYFLISCYTSAVHECIAAVWLICEDTSLKIRTLHVQTPAQTVASSSHSLVSGWWLVFQVRLANNNQQSATGVPCSTGLHMVKGSTEKRKKEEEELLLKFMNVGR